MASTNLPTKIPSRHSLQRWESLALKDAEGAVVNVDAGCVWLTLEGDTRDIVLTPGMRFEIDRTGLTIIAAEEDAKLRLCSPDTASARVQTWLHRTADRLQHIWSDRMSRRTAPYF